MILLYLGLQARKLTFLLIQTHIYRWNLPKTSTFRISASPDMFNGNVVPFFWAHQVLEPQLGIFWVQKENWTTENWGFGVHTRIWENYTYKKVKWFLYISKIAYIITEVNKWYGQKIGAYQNNIFSSYLLTHFALLAKNEKTSLVQESIQWFMRKFKISDKYFFTKTNAQRARYWDCLFISFLN